jgi:hypothetical protein
MAVVRPGPLTFRHWRRLQPEKVLLNSVALISLEYINLYQFAQTHIPENLNLTKYAVCKQIPSNYNSNFTHLMNSLRWVSTL